MKPADLKNLLKSEQQVLLCDVRTKMEYDNIHLEKAENIPLDSIENSDIKEQFEQDKHIVFICKSGARSEKAMKLFQKAGFNNIDFVEGGTDQCHEEGMEVVENKNIMSLERQVRIAAGLLVVIGVILAITVNEAFIALSAFVGAGLVFAGITNTCGMGLLLAKAPWNR